MDQEAIDILLDAPLVKDRRMQLAEGSNDFPIFDKVGGNPRMEYRIAGTLNIIAADTDSREQIFHDGLHIKEVVGPRAVRVAGFFRAPAEKSGNEVVFIRELSQRQGFRMIHMAIFEDGDLIVFLRQIVRKRMHEAWEKAGAHIRVFFGNRVQDRNGFVNRIPFREIQLLEIVLIHEAIVFDL